MSLCLHGLLMLCLPRLHSALASLLAETNFPTGAVCLSVSVPAKLQCHRSLPEPGENLPPHQSPGHRPSPAEPHVPLFMRGRLGQAPQAGRGARHCGKCGAAQILSLPAENRLGRVGQQHPYKGRPGSAHG